MNVRPWLRPIAAAVLTTAATAGIVAVPATALATQSGGSVAESGAGNESYLVRFTPRTDVAGQARELRADGVQVRRTFGRAVKAAVVTATAEEAAALANDPQVLAVEVDAPVHATDTQADAPWGLDRVDQRALPLSTTYTAAANGAGVDVYVVDTGVLAGHVELSGRVGAGYTAISDSYGTSDCNGHGTHVAGTVAGTTYGVAKAARIVPVRVLGCDGSGMTSAVVAGLDWIASHHSAGSPAVVNISLGGATSSILDAALTNVINDGVVASVAAGNETKDACSVSPGRVPAALTVAASDRFDVQASYSNFGSCVDMYAPGTSITSAYHTSSTATARMSGTSMAAPHVAGAAAVLLSQQPTLTPVQVSDTLTADATTGTVLSATPGTPNRLLFLAQRASVEPAPTTEPAPEPAPSTEPAPEPAPTTEPVTEPTPEPGPVLTKPGRAKDLLGKPGQRKATLTWVQGSDGGSPLTRQVVRMYVGTQRVATFTVPSDATGVRVTGLKPGRSYRFTVIEKNQVGASAESARSNKVTPRA